MTSSLISTASAAALCSLLMYSELSAQVGQPQAPPKPTPIAEGFGQGAYRPQPGITEPILIRSAEPKYTSEAFRARIHGEVHLEAIVNTNGSVGPVRIVKSLDATFGLDQEAVKAAQQRLYRPGMYSGKPVPFVVRLVLEFRHSGIPQPVQQMPQAGSATWMDDAEFLKGVVRLGQSGVTMPTLDRSVEPKYTADAMRAKITGTVTVDMVVGPDGSVVRARIARSLDPTLGLDHTALEAARQWRFTPGTYQGQPAHVLVTVTMEFRLH